LPRTPRYGNAQKRHGFGVASSMKYYDEPWGLAKEDLPSIDEFDPDESYTPYQLDRFADAILWDQILGFPNSEYPMILMHEHLQERRRREINVASGTPDETITNDLSADGQTMYWRTHPKGRPVNSWEQREKNGATFYR
jgi:hypothetical protein